LRLARAFLRAGPAAQPQLWQHRRRAAHQAGEARVVEAEPLLVNGKLRR
jgi:hypothetical protein